VRRLHLTWISRAEWEFNVRPRRRGKHPRGRSQQEMKGRKNKKMKLEAKSFLGASEIRS
jgi:hypothetical protein